MKLDPRHLEILAAIVDEGGLTEGAVRLGRSQPSVSRSLALLEERVGEPLFEKGKRPLRPTELGHALAHEGRMVLAAGASASSIVSAYASGKQGLIRLAGPPIFMDGVISPMLAAFQTRFPDIRIEQSYGYVPEALQNTRTGGLDIVIGPINPGAVPDDADFEELLPGRNVIACGALHPLAGRTSIRLSDIAEYPWIAPPPESPLYQDLRATLVSIGIHDIKVSFSGGSLASIINVLSQTSALTVLPQSVLDAQKREKQVYSLPVRINHPKRSLGILQLKSTRRRRSIERLTRFLKNECEMHLSSSAMKGANQVWRG
ncbi:MAG: LysR family transcriptional regulator [Alphaproteobacteria bacterium]|nr:LysR family transcriptional regulator [Alphaproteobacteria bacterium]